MPTYQYACTVCGERLEVVQAFADDPLTECPSCGGRLRKVFSPVGVVFKGSGFYQTDSRKGRSTTGAGSDSGSGEPSKAASGSSSGSGSGSTSGASSGSGAGSASGASSGSGSAPGTSSAPSTTAG